MNCKQLIELTKEFIHNATHYNMDYLDNVYSDKLVIVRVDETGKVDTTTKPELLKFFQQMHDDKAAPLSEQAVFYHAVADDNLALVVLERTMDLYGRMEKMFFTLVWERIADHWHVVKESVVVMQVL
ncbi:hypothetical protein [Pedobacter sp.]|uniref:hypothetical protein n=1 Tax=Pedobacter sp. TaxID=1411316 RepID=UPI003C68B3FD